MSATSSSIRATICSNASRAAFQSGLGFGFGFGLGFGLGLGLGLGFGSGLARLQQVFTDVLLTMIHWRTADLMPRVEVTDLDGHQVELFASRLHLRRLRLRGRLGVGLG